MNMKDNKSISFMAISKGSVSTEGLEIKRFIGVGSVFVLAVNPDKKKLEELYMTQLEKEPEYVGEVEVGEDKHKVKNVRIDFIVKTDPEKCNGIDTTTKVSLFVRQEYMYSKDGSKIQVIDKYGIKGMIEYVSSLSNDSILNNIPAVPQFIVRYLKSSEKEKRIIENQVTSYQDIKEQI